MALSDLAVFSEYVQSMYTELQTQQVGLFNAATRNGLMLHSAPIAGDFKEEAFWKAASGLVRRRDAYGSGDVALKTLTQGIGVAVKVAAGTPPVDISPGMLKWIQKSEKEAGVVVGRQLAEASIADMLNTAIAAFMAGVGAVAGLNYDHSGTGVMTLGALASGAAKMGDRSEALACWIMHSKSLFDLYAASLANSQNLFTFGTVKVNSDGFGRPIVITDSSGLITGGNRYYALGLVPGGVDIAQNDDFTDNIETTNRKENIVRTYQAEWSYNVLLKGFAWDTANGGKSPTAAALATGTNWDQVATSIKDCAGVIVKAQ